MTRLDLLQKVKKRKKQMGITIDAIAKMTNIGNRTVVRFLKGEDVKISTVEKITQLLGLDFAGNEVVSIDKLKQQRAKQKALYVVSLVQDTSSLEQQGLNSEQINLLITQAKTNFLNENKTNLWLV